MFKMLTSLCCTSFLTCLDASSKQNLNYKTTLNQDFFFFLKQRVFTNEKIGCLDVPTPLHLNFQ